MMLSLGHAMMAKRAARQGQAGALKQLMKAIVLGLLVAVVLTSCSSNRGRTTQMFPDCDQVSAEEQRQGRCMHRPDLPDGL
jgi:hypothetical protein